MLRIVLLLLPFLFELGFWFYLRHLNYKEFPGEENRDFREDSQRRINYALFGAWTITAVIMFIAPALAIVGIFVLIAGGVGFTAYMLQSKNKAIRESDRNYVNRIESKGE